MSARQSSVSNGTSWQYDESGTWNDMPKKSSNALSKQFQAGGDTLALTVGKTKYLFDFATMEQTNTSSNFKRTIRPPCGLKAPAAKKRKSKALPPSKPLGRSSSHWQFEEDGKWKDMSDENSTDLLKKLWAGSTSCEISFNGTIYEYDFTTMEQTNQSSNNLRKIRAPKGVKFSGQRQSLPVVPPDVSIGLWQFQESGSWKDMVAASSSQLTSHHGARSKTYTLMYKNVNYLYNFQKMEQTNQKTKCTRKIRPPAAPGERDIAVGGSEEKSPPVVPPDVPLEAPEMHPDVPVGLWQFEESGSWKDMTVANSSQLTSHYGAGSKRHKFMYKDVNYLYNFQKMKQTNQKTNFTRKIRPPAPLRKRYIAVGGSEQKLCHGDIIRKKHNIETLDEVKAFIKNVYKKHQVSSALPILKSNKFKKASHPQHDKLLFHGTSADACIAIQDGTFIPSSSGLLGPGIYFAPNPAKSMGYVQGQVKCMLLCLVNVEGAKTRGSGDMFEYCVVGENAHKKTMPLWVVVYK